jgi:hypothetical protein
MVHTFLERLAFSEGLELGDAVLQCIVAGIPGATEIRRANTNDDRNGTDYWIERDNGLPSISVDVKHRSFCPIARWGKDDACIEVTSVYKGPKQLPWQDEYRHRVGWTLDPAKRTDLIVYTWPASENRRRFWILYFPHLCAVARQNWRKWARDYGELPAWNDGYLTLSVYVPRKVIADAIQTITAATIP